QEITPNSPQQILAKPEIPILCYHRIANGRNDAYSVSPETFASHLQVLADSGYNSVLPDALHDYLLHNKPLPEKPVVITFDDSRIEHIEIAAPELEKRNFRGTFFIMTVTYNKKGYMSTGQIAEMAKRGHTVGLHSWDHVMATKYTDSAAWAKQVIEPKKKLEEIIGQPVQYWAYPNGVYNRNAAEELAQHFDLSFILMSKRDSVYPLQTVKRMIVPEMPPQKLIKSMMENFR
ncbi:MAG: polysaccharide deacetylase family protein, partial [Bacteroidia bacterium]|nr:polysaccharide deacetylase family protein [Bacteroidia bacterium]